MHIDITLTRPELGFWAILIAVALFVVAILFLVSWFVWSIKLPIVGGTPIFHIGNSDIELSETAVTIIGWLGFLLFIASVIVAVFCR